MVVEEGQAIVGKIRKTVRERLPSLLGRSQPTFFSSCWSKSRNSIHLKQSRSRKKKRKIIEMNRLCVCFGAGISQRCWRKNQVEGEMFRRTDHHTKIKQKFRDKKIRRVSNTM